MTEPPPPLNSKRWKEFLIKDLFITIKNGKQVLTGAYVSKDNLRDGNTPRITVTANNNGVYNFYDSSDKNYKVAENFISVSFLGDAFYHPYKASLDMKVHCLKLANRELNRFIGLFMVRMLKQMSTVFNYGDQLSSTDIVNKKIQLPVNDNDEPDFEYMENYIRAIEEKQLQKYREFVEIAPPLATIQPLNKKSWQEFFIEEIFEILPGKRLTKAEMIPGDTPFIGASDSNNGVTAFIGNDNESADENFLSVSYNGSVCQCFYQQYRCLCSDDVKRFHLKNRSGNKYLYLFLANCIRQQKDKYNYGYKFNEARMRRQKIMLPVDDAGEPDFDYMEAYIKSIMAAQYKKYLDYID